MTINSVKLNVSQSKNVGRNSLWQTFDRASVNKCSCISTDHSSNGCWPHNKFTKFLYRFHYVVIGNGESPKLKQKKLSAVRWGKVDLLKEEMGIYNICEAWLSVSRRDHLNDLVRCWHFQAQCNNGTTATWNPLFSLTCCTKVAFHCIKPSTYLYSSYFLCSTSAKWVVLWDSRPY